MITKYRFLASALFLSLVCAVNARADITNNLSLYLPLDETTGTNVTDASPNGNNGTLVGFVNDDSQWVAGKIAGAIQVDVPSQTAQYVSVPQAASLDFGTSGAVTVAAWVKTTSTTQVAGSAIICKGTGGGNEEYDLDISAATSGKFRIVTRNNASTASSLIATVGPTATFQHVAAVIDANAHTLKIYINGQLNVSSSPVAVTNLKTSSHVVSIGNRQSTATSAYNLPFVNGVIDDVHIYGRALTASDVFELYASHGSVPIMSTQPKAYTCNAGDVAAFAVTVDAVNSVVPAFYQWQLNGTNIPNATNATVGITNVQTSMSGQPVTVIVTNVIGMTVSTPTTLTVLPLPAADIVSDLAGYYTFDDTPGSTTAADSTTNATTATLIGFADTTSVWTNGLINGALNFNADASTVNLVAIPNVFTTVPPVLDFTTNGLFTLAAWVNGAATQISGACVFAKGTGNGGEQFAVDINGGHYRYYLRNAAGAVSTVTTSVSPNGTWQHIICVLNTSNGVMNCYINGQLAGESIAPTNLLASTHEISIGNRQSASGAYNLPWTGLIDDVRFYNRTFNAADAQALYLQGGVFPPTFVTQPVGASLFVGDNFKLVSAVNGTAPITYQWLNGATVLPLATNATLSFLPTVASNAGNYTLVVSNAYGMATSSVATLTLAPFTVNSALAAYWAFDDGINSSTAADASGNNNNGTLTSFPDFTSEWITGRVNGGLLFNQPGGSTNEYVDILDAPSLNFSTTSNFSLACWVRGSTVQVSGAGIICKGIGSLNEQYTIDVNAGFYRFFVRNSAGTATQITSATGAPTGRWQHLVATYDGGFTTMNLYLDGVLIGTTAAAPPALLVDNGHDVSIGAREQNSSSGYNFPFNGSIDDVRIYNRTLNSNDVQTVYQAAGLLAPVFYLQPRASASLFAGDNLTLNSFADGSAPVTLQWQKDGTNIPNATNASLSLVNVQLTDAGTYVVIASNSVTSVPSSNSVVQVTTFSITNTAAYFNLDETTGSVAADSSGNGNTGSLIGFPGDDSEWSPGRINGALTFNADGTGQTVVTAPDSPTLNFSNGLAFSVAAWVRGPAVQANGAGIVAKGAGGGGEQYAVDVHSDLIPAQTYRFFVRAGTGGSITAPTTVAPNNRWQHVAATFDGGSAASMNVYVNGQVVASNVAPGSLLVSSHEVSIGNRQSSAATGYNLPFTGQMDDVRIYSRALKASEIQSLYNLAATFGPVVYTQPADMTNYTGTAATFAPAVDGTDPLTYQWSKNGNPIASATSSILSITNVQLSDAGSYSLHVTGAGSPTNTAAAILTILPLQFSGATALPDGTLQLTISGPPNGSYHLYTSPTVNTPFAQWTLLTSGTFDITGSAIIVDPTPTSNNPSLYYRFTLP